MSEFRAFALAPIPAAGLGGLASWASGASPEPLSPAMSYLVLLYVAQCLLGLPIHALFLKKRTSALSFALGGAAMVALPAAPYLAWAWAGQPYPLSHVALVYGLLTMLGGVTGWSYRWLLRRKDTKSRRGLFRRDVVLALPYFRSETTEIGRIVSSLLENRTSAEPDVSAALWAELEEEVRRVLTAAEPQASCAARRKDRKIECAVRLPDGTEVGEMIALRDLTEERLEATGERLRRRAAGEKVPLVDPFKRLVGVPAQRDHVAGLKISGFRAGA